MVTKDDMERVKIAILLDPRCVRIGEIGIDLSGSFGHHKEAQVKVLKRNSQVLCRRKAVGQGPSFPLSR